MRYKPIFILVLCLFLIFHVCPVFSASNVSVSPETLSSDQGAWLTVTADVASGSDIHISIIVDFNGDGARNGYDFVMQYFKLKEGVAPGVSQSPKPGDEDGQNAHLLTHIDMWDRSHFTGHYIIDVEDSMGNASDIVSITQPNTGQSVSGTLYNHNDDPNPGFIGALDWEGREWFTATNVDGAYTINLPPGNVIVAGYAIQNTTEFKGQGAQSFLLSPGENKIGIDLRLAYGNYGVMGKIKDVSSSQGVRNIIVSAEGKDKACITLTDFDGNYYMVLSNGTWEIGVDGVDCNQRGLAGQNSREVVVNNAGVIDFHIELSQATTYISGSVKKKKDSSPLVRYEVRAEYGAMGSVSCYTRGTDGSYIILVNEADWRVGIDEDDVRRGGFIQPPSQAVHPLTGSPATGLDFLLQEPDSSIEVEVKDKDTEDPVAGIGVHVTEESWSYEFNDSTDAGGNAVFPVVAGTYHVSLHCPDIFSLNYAAPAVINAAVGSSETKPVLFEIEKAKAFIDGSLLFNPDPPQGVNVNLMNDAFEWLAFAQSQADGSFHIPVMAGTYHVQPDGAQLMARNIAPVPAKEATLTSGTVDVNFNLAPSNATIRIQVTGEGSPLNNIGVSIKESAMDGSPLAVLSTDSSGYATFKVVAGEYFAEINQDQVFASGFLPREGRIVNVTTGQTKDDFFWLLACESQAALDAILQTYPFDNVERRFLDANNDEKLDVADIISLIIDGK
jgi:hypothetical protein